MQAHFCTNPLEGSGQEVRTTHPVLDRPKGVFHRLASGTHGVWRLIQASLHDLKDFLMRPAGDASLLTGGALFLDRALLAMRAPVLVLF